VSLDETKCSFEEHSSIHKTNVTVWLY